MRGFPAFVSVVIPIFNEEENIVLLTDKLTSVLSEYENYEIIFVNDGSNDNSEELIRNICNQNKSVKLINLSRNFGHQAAITAGMTFCRGNVLIVMDGDFQDPPDLIPELIKKWQEGYDIVHTTRKIRKDSFFKKITASMFYRFFNKISSLNIPLDGGDFSLIDRKIIDILNSLPEKNRFIRGLRSWTGFKQVQLEFERPERSKGKSKYLLIKLFKLGMDGIISFSHKPLILSTFVGIFIIILSILSVLIAAYLSIFTTFKVAGIIYIILPIFFIGGLQLFSVGILGEYISRIYDEVKGRPNFVVSETKNID